MSQPPDQRTSPQTRTGGARRAEDLPLPGGSFTLFVQKLAYQTLMMLGVVENPLTRRKEPNLPFAQAAIDDLMMLREKTRGNLSPEEEQQLTQVVGELQRHFVQLKQQG
jgi:uncharacterized protein DUF1844